MILIGCCAIAAIGFGLCINSMGVFFPKVAESIGATSAQVASYLTVQCLVMVVDMYVVGRLIRKENIKLLLSLAAITISLSYLCLSFGTRVWHWYIIAVPIGFASGIAYSFTGIMGATLSPIASNLISSFGWQATYRIIALIPIILLLPLTLFLIEFSPEQKNLLPYGMDTEEHKKARETSQDELPVTGISFATAKTSIIFYFCILSSGLFSLAGGFHQQFPNYALPLGLSIQIGSFMVTVCMVTQLIVNLPLGILCDKIGVTKAGALFSALGICGAIILALAQIPTIIFIGCVLYGFGINVCMVVPPLMARDAFGTRDYPRINFFVMMGGAFLPRLMQPCIPSWRKKYIPTRCP